MQSTDLLIQTDRFELDWGDGDDTIPPPGYDLAAALLKNLISLGVESRQSELDEDSWEHCNWYFYVEWDATTYDIIVQPSFEETEPPTWHIGVSKSLGLFKSLFGRSKHRYDLADSFLQLVEKSVKQATGLEQIEWMTQEEVGKRMDQAPSKPRNWDKPTQVAHPNAAGWVKCAGCGMRFKPKKSKLFKDGRHICGQLIEIAAKPPKAADN